MRRMVVIVLGGILLLALFVPATRATTVEQYCLAPVELDELQLINDYRAANGLGPLAASQTLGAAAEHHALDMATTGDLTHTLSDGTTWLDNIINHGYPYGYRTENIAWGYGSALSVFNAWKASSTHNSHMLEPGFGAIGVKRVYDPTKPYQYFWVTTFGSLLDTPAVTCPVTPTPVPSATPTPKHGH